MSHIIYIYNTTLYKYRIYLHFYYRYYIYNYYTHTHTYYIIYKHYRFYKNILIFSNDCRNCILSSCKMHLWMLLDILLEMYYGKIE